MMAVLLGIWQQPVLAETSSASYQLGAGDVLRINVHNNPDLSLETRVPEDGAISYPLIGNVSVNGLTVSAAEKKIATMLEKGGFVKQPQVNILVLQFQSKMVSVLGSVNKPGRYPLERVTSLPELIALAGGPTIDGSDLITIVNKSTKTQYDLNKIIGNTEAESITLNGGEIVYIHSRDVSVLGQVNRPGKYAVTNGVRTLADFISVAGGIAPGGSDIISLSTFRNGDLEHLEIDVDKVFRSGSDSANFALASGDMIYVPRAPIGYIFGEVQRPGAFRIERDMTVVQALAQGGGPTARGTQRGIKLHRRNPKGEVEVISVKLTDKVQAEDVLYIQESLF